MIQYIIVDTDTDRVLGSMGNTSKPDTWHWLPTKDLLDIKPCGYVFLTEDLGYAESIAARMERTAPDLKLSIQKVKVFQAFELVGNNYQE